MPPIDSSYYEGTGYGKVVIGRESSTLRINLDIHARSENGLLFFIESEVNDRSCGYFINIMFSCILICTIRKSLNTVFSSF